MRREKDALLFRSIRFRLGDEFRECRGPNGLRRGGLGSPREGLTLISQGSMQEIRLVARMVDMRFVLGVACTLVFGTPLASSATRGDGPEGWFEEDGGPGFAEAVLLGRPFAEATLTAPVGTPFEFSVDWTTGKVSLVPLVLGSVELPGPDAGCTVTEAGTGWVVEPAGFQAFGECPVQVFHQWPVSRSLLACVIGAGSCRMSLSGSLLVPGGGGNVVLYCTGGPGASLPIWPTTWFVKTTTCQTDFIGSFPSEWAIWSGYVRLAPSDLVGAGVASGLNWRFEP